jgi:hypothetical protein
MDRSTVLALMEKQLSHGARMCWLLLRDGVPNTYEQLAEDLRCTKREARRRVDELEAVGLAEKKKELSSGSGYGYYGSYSLKVRRLPLGTVEDLGKGPNRPAVAGGRGNDDDLCAECGHSRFAHGGTGCCEDCDANAAEDEDVFLCTEFVEKPAAAAVTKRTRPSSSSGRTKPSRSTRSSRSSGRTKPSRSTRSSRASTTKKKEKKAKKASKKKARKKA